ncbi:MAG: Sua5/YciO/YrdC/YwlC family protein, partial [Thermofilaceae archaeon]
MNRKAAIVRITGVVQGVGFRPFIYRVAVKLGVTGYVKNLGGSEVEVWVEGPDGLIEKFFQVLKLDIPPPAELEDIIIQYVEPRGYTSFKILESGSSVAERSQIPPDIGVCDECLTEVLDLRSRWYSYPFNSCAWCGPRFSMMYTTPYDRTNTTMRDFPMCNHCLEEYSNWSDTRRFHAQGISCPKCGPSLRLLNTSGEDVSCENPIIEAARLIDEGNIVAIKGLGGFHLASLASDDTVVNKLRVRKRRPRKPLALMALNLDVVRAIACPTEGHIKLLKSPQRPIVLIPKREGAHISDLIAPGLADIGVMLPYTPLHYLIINNTKDKFLIMTSGNKLGLPICIGLEATRELKGIADAFLLHNREII